MNDSVQQWQIPLFDLKLGENEVHVWRASLEVDITTLSTLQQLLTQEEVTKAKQFRFEKDQCRCIVARGVLRTLLGHYLNTDPPLLRFEYNAYGKPSLAHPFSESMLRFNISHSHEMALYAFIYDQQVGVDVEYMRSGIDYDQLAKYSFSPYEQAELRALPQALKHQGFFNCWTRKEAYIKAIGKGVSLPLDSFDVSLRPSEPAILLASRETLQESTIWTLQELSVGSGYAGALVVEGSGWDVRYWQWTC